MRVEQIGDCCLINGDCFEVSKKFRDKQFDLIMTDIPYCISKENNFKTMKDRKNRNGIDFGGWDKEFDCSRLRDFARLLKSDDSLFLFHSFEQYSDLRCAFDDELEFKDNIIWQKTNPMPRNRDRRYIRDIEIASWYVVKGGKWTFNRQSEKYDSSVLRYPSESGGGFKRFHPTQKNLQMMKEIILRHSSEGDVVFDPFMGSWTTALACKETGRNFVGIELDEAYFNVSVGRLKGEI